MKSGKHMAFGIFCLLFGLSILLRIFFGWHIPIFRTFLGIFLVYMGIRMVVGGSWGWHAGWRIKDSENVVFGQGAFRFEKDARNRYSTVFGSSTVDLSQVVFDGKSGADLRVHVDTVFGETKIMIDPKQATIIRANSVFGEVRMPNDDMVAFGTLNYKTPAAEKTGPKLKIEANVVFGSIKFLPSQAAAKEADDD